MENDVKEVLQKLEEKLNDEGMVMSAVQMTDDDWKEVKKLYRVTDIGEGVHKFEKIDQHGHRVTKSNETTHDEMCWECRRLKSLE